MGERKKRMDKVEVHGLHREAFDGGILTRGIGARLLERKETGKRGETSTPRKNKEEKMQKRKKVFYLVLYFLHDFQNSLGYILCTLPIREMRVFFMKQF